MIGGIDLSYFIKIVIIIAIITAVIFIKHKFLNQKWTKRLIAVCLLLLFVFIIIPLSLKEKELINGILYIIIASLFIPTDKIFNYLKKR